MAEPHQPDSNRFALRVRMPETVAAGAYFEVRTIASHEMESGYRRDSLGRPVPRHIIDRFEAWIGEELALALDLGPGIAANPYFAFELRLERSAEVRLWWRDDRGQSAEHRQWIDVREA